MRNRKEERKNKYVDDTHAYGDVEKINRSRLTDSDCHHHGPGREREREREREIVCVCVCDRVAVSVEE